MTECLNVVGASIAVAAAGFNETSLYIIGIQRDSHVSYPNYWEFPGGGREANESPLNCALRELHEESGVMLGPETVVWEAFYPRLCRIKDDVPQFNAFYAALLSSAERHNVTKGSEGQACGWMPLSRFIGTSPDAVRAIPDHIDRWHDFLYGMSGRYLGRMAHQTSAFPVAKRYIGASDCSPSALAPSAFAKASVDLYNPASTRGLAS